MSDFKPGVYKHYKGGLYRALFLAQDSTNVDLGDPTGQLESTQELCVVYVALDGAHAGQINVRTLAQWHDLIGGGKSSCRGMMRYSPFNVLCCDVCGVRGRDWVVDMPHELASEVDDLGTPRFEFLHD